MRKSETLNLIEQVKGYLDKGSYDDFKERFFFLGVSSDDMDDILSEVEEVEGRDLGLVKMQYRRDFEKNIEEEISGDLGTE